MGVAASPIVRTRTDRATGFTVRALVVAGALLAVAGSVTLIASGRAEGWLTSGSALLGVVALGWGFAALSVTGNVPGNRVAWALAASSLAGLAVACVAATSLLTGSVPALAGSMGNVQADLVSTVAWLRSIALIAATVAVLVPMTFGFLLFPVGSLPSPRWRVVGPLAGFAIGGQCLAWLAAIQPGRGGEGLGSSPVELALVTSGLVVLVACSAQVPRLRSGAGVVRQQSKWVVWGAVVCATAFAAGIAVAGSAGDAITTPFPAAGVVVLAAAYAAAMGRRWLHEIDLVISRSLVYAALGAFVVVVSVGSLIVASRLFDGGGDPNMVVAIAATTGIAAGFRPLRERLQAGVERAVFGRTATAHVVLSEFSRRVAANGEDPLSLVARSMVEGTGAVHAQVWLGVGRDQVRAAEWPLRSSMASREATRFPISHAGTTLGTLVLGLPDGGRLSVEDRDLVEQVASGMGLAIRNGMLASTLEQRVAQLRASRRRLIGLQDGTRRRLERDLHDGAQQQLVALRVKLGLARVMADRDGATRTAGAIDEVASLAETAIDALRDLARGVYPPLLEVEGLAASIASEARRTPFPTTLRLGELARYDPVLEGTIYLCVVEGLRSVAKAGVADETVVSIVERGDSLAFSVSVETSLDGGSRPPPGLALAPGLAALVDRVDTLAGSLSIGPAPDAPGRVLAGTVPIGDGAAP